LPYREHKPGLLDHGSFHASMSPRKGDASGPVSEKNSSRHLSISGDRSLG